MMILTMGNVIITGSLVCLLASPAFAQSEPAPTAPAQQPLPALLPGAPPLSQAPEPGPRDTRPRALPGSPKSELTANLMTLGGVLLPVGLVVGAVNSLDSPPRYSLLMSSAVVSLVFTPSAGNWYTGRVLTPGLGLRVAGGLVALLGLGVGISECPFRFDSEGGSCQPTGAIAILVIGGATAAAGIVHDALSAPRRVRQYNRARGFEMQVGITPVVAPHSTGLALAGQF
jgi:hypothetical protein